jgi:hypothetical protein
MRYVFGFWFAFVLSLALMAGCSDENGQGGSGGTGGTGGMAGTGGTAGGGGSAGTGGTGGVQVESGSYTFMCRWVHFGFTPLPVVIHISAVDPGFTEGMPSELTTSLDYSVAPAVMGVLPDLAPDAQVVEVNATIGVTGGNPVEILHNATVPALPFAPTDTFSSTEVTRSVTPSANEVSLAVTAVWVRVEGLPPVLEDSGEILLAPGNPDFDCGGLRPLVGSGPLTFQVQP